jgi:hypothetical protein
MGAVRAEGPGDVFTRWWQALSRHDSPTRAARELYAGDLWTVSMDLVRAAQASGFDARLWVASAGYGLVPAEAQLRAYAATFTPGHADPVVEPGAEGARRAPRAWWDAARAWWARLSREAGPSPNAPRSVADLVRSSPGAKVFVVASPRYLGAMEDDLREASHALADLDDLLLVSSEPGPSDAALREHFIPSVAALQPVVGGARMALHARVGRRILEEAAERGLKVSAVRERLAELTRSAPPLERYDRTPLVDDAVRSYIRHELDAAPGVTHTRLLRKLRSSGRACEQGRFRTLFFQEVKRR